MASKKSKLLMKEDLVSLLEQLVSECEDYNNSYHSEFEPVADELIAKCRRLLGERSILYREHVCDDIEQPIRKVE